MLIGHCGMASKWKHISPVEGMDKCAECEDNLNISTNVMNCDAYVQWLCADCLDLSEPEYIILTKMTHCMSCD